MLYSWFRDTSIYWLLQQMKALTVKDDVPQMTTAVKEATSLWCIEVITCPMEFNLVPGLRQICHLAVHNVGTLAYILYPPVSLPQYLAVDLCVSITKSWNNPPIYIYIHIYIYVCINTCLLHMQTYIVWVYIPIWNWNSCTRSQYVHAFYVSTVRMLGVLFIECN